MPSMAITWAQRLKRVFDIDVETCRICGGAAKVIACIEDPVVIQKMLAHLRLWEEPEPWSPPAVPEQTFIQYVPFFDS